MQSELDYHGIVVNISQRDKRIFSQLELLSTKTVIPCILLLHKINVKPEKLEHTIRQLQENMTGQLFYVHLYRAEELIVVFNRKVFKASPNKETWRDLIAYGRSLHIPAFWLDFRPCRIEDEQF